MSDLKFVIVAPTYQNARTLLPLLDGLAAMRLTVIVVDDGCHDETPEILREWIAQSPNDRRMITHEGNRGKAAALRTGFALAASEGFTHALSIDTDGQHDVGDVPRLIQRAIDHPDSLILGTRLLRAHDSRSHRPPFKSTIGRRISNHFVWLESGAHVADSQCGLRVYPLGMERKINARTNRYGYETEVLTRFAWAGASIVQEPICCIYDVAGGRTTHFRPLRDSLAASWMHARLVLRSLTPWPTRKLIERPNESDANWTGTIVERLLRWMNPMRVWRELRSSQSNRKRFAASAASGVALAALPPYGLKTITCLLWSKWFRLDSAVMVAASSLNTPPVGPIFAAMGIVIGHAILHGEWPGWAFYNPSQHGLKETLYAVGFDWLVGSLFVAALLSTLVYFIARYGLTAIPFDSKIAPQAAARDSSLT